MYFLMFLEQLMLLAPLLIFMFFCVYVGGHARGSEHR